MEGFRSGKQKKQNLLDNMFKNEYKNTLVP